MSGQTIREARKSRGLKQVQLARDAKIHFSRLSMIENGWIDASADEISRIAAALGLRQPNTKKK